MDDPCVRILWDDSPGRTIGLPVRELLALCGVRGAVGLRQGTRVFVPSQYATPGDYQLVVDAGKRLSGPLRVDHIRRLENAGLPKSGVVERAELVTDLISL